MVFLWSKLKDTNLADGGLSLHVQFWSQYEAAWNVMQSLKWCHNGRDGVSNHQRHDYLLRRLFGRRSNKILKLRITDLCEENSPVTGEFLAQMASKAENVSIWRRHHDIPWTYRLPRHFSLMDMYFSMILDSFNISSPLWCFGVWGHTCCFYRLIFSCGPFY